MSRLVAVFARLCFACFVNLSALRALSSLFVKVVGCLAQPRPLVSQSAALHRNRGSSRFVDVMLVLNSLGSIYRAMAECIYRLCRRRGLQAVADNKGKNIGRCEYSQALLHVVNPVPAAPIRPSFLPFAVLHRHAAMPPL